MSIVSFQQENLRHTLEGHTASVNCAEFCPHYSATLVTASDDRRFKVSTIIIDKYWGGKEIYTVIQVVI